MTNEVNRIIIAAKNPLPTLDKIKTTAKSWAFGLYRVGIDSDELANKFAP